MLTRERLKEALHYNPKTGHWVWRITQGKAITGQRAGRIQTVGPTNYQRRKIGLDGNRYTSARLAVFYMTGFWPEHEMDHRDGDSLNDCWRNLRQGTHEQNSQNVCKHSDNGTGFKGVIFHRGGGKKRTRRYQAVIQTYGRRRSLGYHLTAAEAHAAYVEAELSLRKSWRRGSGISLDKWLQVQQKARRN